MKQIIIKTLPIAERYSKKAALPFLLTHLGTHGRRRGTNIGTPAAVTYHDWAQESAAIIKDIKSVKVANKVIAIYLIFYFPFIYEIT